MGAVIRVTRSLRSKSILGVCVRGRGCLENRTEAEVTERGEGEKIKKSGPRVGPLFLICSSRKTISGDGTGR